VYRPAGGGAIIVSARSTPPAGYVPVKNVRLSIDGLSDTTDSSGEYFITGITPGTQTLVVTVPGSSSVNYSIPIVADKITLGAGHQEGGG
jgi:hypothetical protein